jgi:hypothetical protein
MQIVRITSAIANTKSSKVTLVGIPSEEDDGGPNERQRAEGVAPPFQPRQQLERGCRSSTVLLTNIWTPQSLRVICHMSVSSTAHAALQGISITRTDIFSCFSWDDANHAV